MAENYIVSARKYRPQTFDTVVGQEHITTTLKNAIRNNHLAHAYLFCGPRGVGKTTCARILARTINCQNPTPDMEACGVCPTCQAFKDHTSFNIFELDAASNNSVDDIRSLTDQVRFAPQTGKYKVYIIDEVHMLSASAFNAFLKTLEEPPPYAIFILATTEKHKILPTILSRCQIFDFKRITTHDITNHLQGIASKESMVAEEAALHVIAQKSEGCMRDALSMLDRIASFTNGMLTYGGTMQHLNLLDADYYFKLVDCMLAQDVSNTLLLLDEVLEKGFEGDVVIEGLAEHMRNLLLCKDPRMAKLLDVPKDHQAVYYEKANQTPPSFIVSALNILNDCELNYKNANNKRLHVEMCLIRLCYVMQATQGADVKKNSSEVSTPQASYQPPAPAQNIAPTPPQAKPQAQPTPAPQPQKEVPQPSVPPIAKSEPPVNAQPATDNQPAPAPPPMPRSTPNGNGARRISKNMMDEIEQALNTTIAQAAEEKELTQELVEEVFAKWIKKLKDESREVYHAQFISMTVEAAPPDEVRIVSPTHLAEEYAKAQRDVLIDFFRVETGIQMLRVMTEVREDAAAAAAEQPTVLSRTEMYEEMAKKNPLLEQLKNGLGMQIEY